MKNKKFAIAALAALAIPSTALAAQPTDPGSQGQAHKASAPGQACKGQSKKKAEGQKKTAFAICVSGYKKQAAAEQKAAEEGTKAPNPAETCKGQSKKKAEGQKKSPYAACVVGAARAHNDAS